MCSSKEMFLQQTVLTSQGLPGHWRHLLTAESYRAEFPSYFVSPQFGQLRAGATTQSWVPQELFPALSSTCAECLHVKDTVNRDGT